MDIGATMTRRDNVRRNTRTSGSAAAAPVSFKGVGSFSGSDYWQSTVVDEPPLGSTSMTLAILAKITALSTTSQILFQHGPASGSGVVIRAVSAGRVHGYIYDGAAALKQAPFYTCVAGDVGKTALFALTYDSTTLRFYCDGTEAGSGTASTGYTTPSGQNTYIGSYPLFAPTTTFDILGLWYSHTDVMTGAELTTWYNAIKASLNQDTAPSGVSLTAHWSGKDAQSLPALWEDTVAGYQTYKVGTGGTGVSFTPEWR